jgi:AcrR family transcriptional regulator
MQNSTTVRSNLSSPAHVRVPPCPFKAARAPDPRAGGPLHKGQQTKAAIIDAALGLATQIGLEGLSIGALAEVMHMSKSGVFAHFGSREELQISVIREYHTVRAGGVLPGHARAARPAALRALFANWMKRTSVEIDSGCIYISGAVEFDDRPARCATRWPVGQDLARGHAPRLMQAKEEGHLRADADEEQMLFEIHGLILALHYEARFLKNPGSIDRANAGFANILSAYGAERAIRTSPPNPPIHQSIQGVITMPTYTPPCATCSL